MEELNGLVKELDQYAIEQCRWRRHHGEHLQPAWAWSSPGGCLAKPRLPDGLRSQPVFCHRGGGDQSPYRLDLSLFGPEGEV